MGAPKAPEVPTVIQDPAQMEGAKRHKDHYHDKNGNKFYGNTNLVEDQSKLTPHKGHFHDESGTKIYGELGHNDEQDMPPTEEDIIEETVSSERKQAKHAKKKTSSINTMLQSTGSGGAGTRQGHRLG